MLPELKEIQARRVRLGLSQRDLARGVGISQSSVAKIETGRMNPPYEVVRGIFTFLNSTESSLAGKVAEIASRPVQTVSSSDSVLRAVEILQSTGFKQLPVRDRHLWVGCVYERTIARYMTGAEEPRSILRRKVGSIMDEALPTVVGATPIPTVIPLLQRAQAVLVTHLGEVTGIVTNADLLKVLRPDSGKFALTPINQEKRVEGRSKERRRERGGRNQDA